MILGLLFTHADEAFYVRDVARRTKMSVGAVQRELGTLSDAGIVTRSQRGNHIYYQANPACPVFEELRGLVVKTCGVVDVLSAALLPVADGIEVALVYGSMATGTARSNSDVDLLVIGEVPFGKVVSLVAGAQSELGREINPIVFSAEETRTKLAAGNHFLRSVMDGEHLYVVGDSDELRRLIEERLAG